jgi:hypothetical protein
VVIDALSLSASDAVLKEMIRDVLSLKMKESSSDGPMQLRYATVMSKIMAKSSFHFETCLECGVVDSVVALCRAPDVLLSICALELLLDISKSPAGAKYIFNEGVMDWLLSLCHAGASVDQILSAQALTTACDIFTQAMGTATSSDFDATSLFARSGEEFTSLVLQSIVVKLESMDDGGRLSGLHAISNFADLSADTLRLVVYDGQIVAKWLGLLNTAKIEVKAACLHSVARVLDMGPIAGKDPSVQQMKMHILESIGEVKNMPCVAFLVQIAKQPMNELRNASMDVMRSIARGNGWGLQLLYLTPSSALSGFRAFLENRATEHSREGRLVKYTVIEAVSGNPSFALLPEDVQQAVRLLMQQGPEYVPSVPQVGILEA